MAYEPKDNTGSLFANDKREKETHANARGSAVIDGKHYFVDAWTNTTNDGKKYQSLKFKLKDKQPAAQSGGFAPQSPDLDDDVPF